MATADREWVMYTITDEIEHVALAPWLRACTPNICLIITIIHTWRLSSCPQHIPTKTSNHFFLRFPEMLQGGHLLSWYHEILHACLSPVWSPLVNSDLRRIKENRWPGADRGVCGGGNLLIKRGLNPRWARGSPACVNVVVSSRWEL